MPLRYGFYNSVDGDRKYNTRDFSQLFDGVIRDGVIASIGMKLMITAAYSDPYDPMEDVAGYHVVVGTGRAWFNRTWTDLDIPITVNLTDNRGIYARYDALVLEIDESDGVRENKFLVIVGSPSSTPVYPELTNTNTLHQYPIAYIYRQTGLPSDSTHLNMSHVTNMVGTEDCPFVTGILESVSTSDLLVQWNAQFDIWFQAMKDHLTTDAAGNLQTQINADVANLVTTNAQVALKLNTNATATSAEIAARTVNNRYLAPAYLPANIPNALPGPIGSILISDGNAWLSSNSPSIRTKLSANKNMYVNTAGNDSNSGDSVGQAFLTVQRAVDMACSNYELGTSNIYIIVGDGTYTNQVFLRPYRTIGGSIFIVGNETTPSNVLFSVTNGNCINNYGDCGAYNLRGVKMQAITTGSAIVLSKGTDLTLGNVVFGIVQGYHMSVTEGATITIGAGGYTVSDNCWIHVNVGLHSTFNNPGLPVKFTKNTTAATTWFKTDPYGYIYAAGITYTNKAYATGQYYNVSGLGFINTNGGGATYLPGNAAGVVVTGGLYA